MLDISILLTATLLQKNIKRCEDAVRQVAGHCAGRRGGKRWSLSTLSEFTICCGDRYMD